MFIADEGWASASAGEESALRSPLSRETDAHACTGEGCFDLQRASHRVEDSRAPGVVHYALSLPLLPSGGDGGGLGDGGRAAIWGCADVKMREERRGMDLFLGSASFVSVKSSSYEIPENGIEKRRASDGGNATFNSSTIKVGGACCSVDWEVGIVGRLADTRKSPANIRR
ncbi:hypothetical protein B0H19DRAFT_1241568 [Mycena capillaripes]|nr:hypothetical protein B0H19DRAFT_1241568 [Mycena capillaripes]